MAQVKSRATLSLTIQIEYTEAEARLLLDITKFGEERFTQIVQDILGEDDFKPHRSAVPFLFSSIRDGMRKHINAVDKARETYKGMTEGQ